MTKMVCLFAVAFLTLNFNSAKAQNSNPENWTADQLIEPSALAQTLKSDKNVPLIYSVGPGVVIPHSINIGMVKDAKNLQKFKDSLNKVPRDANIVIYCGCCPFDHCPDVRPAIRTLKAMKFTNYHLLNLPHNIRTDWIAKGYPEVKK